MRYEHPKLHQGMTAIAAALALSSTSLLAQSVDTPAPASSAPALVTPPPVIAPSDSTPAASSATQSSALPVQASPSPEKSTIVEDAAADTAAVPVTKTPPRPAAASRPSHVAATRFIATQSVPQSAPVTKNDVAPTLAPIAQPDVTPAPAAKAQPVAPLPASDETLPVAGLGGLALLALVGGAVAIGRRKRYGDDADFPVTSAAVPIDRPVPDAQPVVAYPSAPVNTLPDGFDTSRFGPHTQAAYRGPTPDNPSLSLTKRLKRASFFDQRERMAAATQAGRPVLPAAARAETVPADRRTDHVVTRVKYPVRPGFRLSLHN